MDSVSSSSRCVRQYVQSVYYCYTVLWIRRIVSVNLCDFVYNVISVSRKSVLSMLFYYCTSQFWHRWRFHRMTLSYMRSNPNIVKSCVPGQINKYYFTASHYHHYARQHWTHVNACRVSCGDVSNMWLVLSISFCYHYNIWGCMCSTGPFQFRWLEGCIHSPCYCHNQIGSIHLSHCYHIFLWLCAWDACYIIFCHLLFIHSGTTAILISLLLCSLWWVQIVGYVLACRSYSSVCTLHHLIIIIVQTYLKTLNF